MARRTKEEALETRNHLLDAAEVVFHRQGYARTTLEAVAESAGVTRGAIYWHFKNKSDLFNAMFERVKLPMEELAESGINANNDDPLGHMRRICVFFLTEAATNVHVRKVMDILFHKLEFVDPSDLVFIRAQEGFLRGREKITRLLEQAVEKGQLDPDTDIRMAAIMFQASIEGLLKNWLFVPDSFDLAKEAERLVNVFIDALRYAPGLRTTQSNKSCRG